MTNDPDTHLNELISSTLALKPRRTDEDFVDAVALAIAEEQRFSDSCRAFVRRTLLDAAILLAFGGMFAMFLQAAPVHATIEAAPSLLFPVAVGALMLTGFVRRPAATG